MSRVTLLAPLIGLLFVAPALAQETLQAEETWQIPEAGLTLMVPAGWQILVGPRGEKVMRRVDAASAGFAENVNVVASPARSTSTEELKGSVRQQIERGGIELVKQEVVQISGHDVVSLEYRGALRGVPVRWRIAAYLNGQRQVLITAAVLDERWGTTREPLEAMFSGMKIGELGRAEPRERALHPTAGVSLVPPHGWTQLPPTGGGMWMLSRWAVTKDGREVQALMTLRGQPVPPDATLDVLVEQFGKGAGLELEEAALDVAGSPARVLRNDKAQGNQPRRIAVCLHDGVAYSLALQGPAQAVGVWQQALLSLEWHQRGDPSQFLETLGAPIGVSPQLMIRPPGLVRMLGKNEGELRLGIHDYKRGQGGLMIQIRGMRIQDPAMTTEDLRDRIETQLKQQFPLGEGGLSWDERGGEVPAFLSTPIKGTQGELLLFSVLRSDPQAAVVINFVIYDPTVQGQAAYHQAIRRLLASARRPPQQQPR